MAIQMLASFIIFAKAVYAKCKKNKKPEMSTKVVPMSQESIEDSVYLQDNNRSNDYIHNSPVESEEGMNSKTSFTCGDDLLAIGPESILVTSKSNWL